MPASRRSEPRELRWPHVPCSPQTGPAHTSTPPAGNRRSAWPPAVRGARWPRRPGPVAQPRQHCLQPRGAPGRCAGAAQRCRVGRAGSGRGPEPRALHCAPGGPLRWRPPPERWTRRRASAAARGASPGCHHSRGGLPFASAAASPVGPPRPPAAPRAAQGLQALPRPRPTGPGRSALSSPCGVLAARCCMRHPLWGQQPCWRRHQRGRCGPRRRRSCAAAAGRGAAGAQRLSAAATPCSSPPECGYQDASPATPSPRAAWNMSCQCPGRR
mmetsp:Transcript_81896/g.227026  ORF Transcript_81896/g.227026 Transcript_81896/m.227026 type:complete len:271 (+) Transcript_81896:583-1395(+)